MALDRDAAEPLPAVLLVDDDGELLAFMREQLECLTRRVYVARSPLEALWLLHHLDIDAVVCDLVLGASDGLHLLEQVRTERPDVARVLLTGFGGIAASHAALDVAHAVLHKPTDAASLAALLRWLPGQLGGDEPRAPADAVHLAIGGELNEHTDLSALARATGDLVLDLEHVRLVNSSGAGRLVQLIEEMDEGRVIVRCSPAVVNQLNLWPMLARRLLIRSVMAPLECQECQSICDVAVDVASGQRPSLPDVACETCGVTMELADLPERYFAFLETS